MKKILLALALLTSTPALAQNVTCSTRPTTDASNACASTQFVKNVFSSGDFLPLTDAHIYVGDPSGFAADVAMSGDGTISNTGHLTVNGINSVPPGALYPLNVGGGLLSSTGSLQLNPVSSVLHQWISSINASGIPQLSQPAFADVSGIATLGQLPLGTAGYAIIGNGVSAPSYQGYLLTGTGAVTRTWQSKAADAVSVKDFGAVCDSSTDDTTAIQNAINYAQTNTGAVSLPKGGCKITSALTVSNQLAIFGQGRILTQIILGNTTQNGFVITAPFGIFFKDFKITSSGTQTAGAAILVDAGSGSETDQLNFDNMYFGDNLFNGIDFERAAYWTIQRSVFSNIANKGVIVKNLNNVDAGDSTIGPGNVFISTISVPGSGVIHVYQESSGGLKIIGNKFLGTYSAYTMNLAVGAGTLGPTIVGNSIENQYNNGISLNAQGTPSAGALRSAVISGNEISVVPGASAITSNTAVSGWLLSTVIGSNVIMVDNFGTGPGGTSFGINIDYLDNVSITGNSLEAIQGSGTCISLGTHLARLNLSPTNAFRNCSTKISGLTPTISACGTTPGAATGTAFAGQVTEGTSATGCTLTFPIPFGDTPICTATLSSGTAVGISSLSTTAMTVTHSSVSSNILRWHCNWN